MHPFEILMARFRATRASSISELALLKMVESRIGSRTSQLQDGLLQTLRLEMLNDHNERGVDEVIKRSEMEYESRGRIHDPQCYSLRLRRYGAHVPAAHDFSDA